MRYNDPRAYFRVVGGWERLVSVEVGFGGGATETFHNIAFKLQENFHFEHQKYISS